GVRQSRIGAPAVDLGDRIARALGVLERHLQPLLSEIALVQCDPIGGMVAHRKPVERKGELLRGLGASCTRQTTEGCDARRRRETQPVHRRSPRAGNASETSAQGASTRERAPTAANSINPRIEIQASAAKATAVFMLLWVVMITYPRPAWEATNSPTTAPTTADVAVTLSALRM